MNTSPTAIPTKRRILAATIAAFIITALLGTGIVVIVEKNRSQKQQKVAADITTRVADNIQDHLNRSISATYALAAIIRQNNGHIDNFETLASEMLELYGGMSSFALAPQGIVSSIVPLAGNEKAIGHNLLEDVKRNKEAILAKNTRKLTLAGPFELLQGGQAVAGRLPVFMTDADGTDRFWGFTAVLVGIPQLMKSANLQQIVDVGYHYELSRIHPDSGKRDVFERSTETALSSPVSHDIEIPNGTWTLSLEQTGGWFSSFIVASEITLVLLVSALVSFMFHTLYKLPLTLQQSEERFRALATIAPVGIFYTDRDGECQYVNPEWCRIAGLSLEESLGVGWIKGLHPDDRDMVSSSLNKMVESHGQWELEYRFMSAEGKITWVYGLAASQYDASGKVIKYVGIMQDITERKRMEKALRASEGHYRALVNTIPHGITVIDREHRIVEINDSQVRMYGRPREWFIGRHCYEVFEKRGHICPHCPGVHSMQTGEVAHTETEGVHDDGTRFPVMLHTAPFLLDDGTVGFIEVAEDITEKREIEAIASKTARLASLGEMATGVAHEINNPITGVINCAQLLKDRLPADSNCQDIVERISREGTRIAKIVKSLLMITYPGHHRVEEFCLREKLDTVLTLFQAKLVGSGIQLHLDLPPDLPPIAGEPQMIEQLLLNLINNAHHALNERYPEPHEEKRLTVSATLKSAPTGGRVCLAVHDQGTGVRTEHLGKLFDPFFTTKPAGVGTGLGLGLCYEIVKRHNGEIRLESEPGRFTRVTVELPVLP